MSDPNSSRLSWHTLHHFPVLIAGCLSVVFYLSGLGSIFFLAPYAWLLSVYAVQNVLLVTLYSSAILITARIIQSVSFAAIVLELLFFHSLVITLLALLVPIHKRFQSIRGLYRMLIPVALFMACTLPFVYNRIQNPELLAMLTHLFDEILSSDSARAELLPVFGEEQLSQIIRNGLRFFCAVYVAVYMLVPLISWWIIQTVQLLSPRMLFRNSRPTRKQYALEKFRVPHNSILVLIATIFVLLLCVVFQSQSLLFYMFANATTIMLLLYTIQGFSLMICIGARRYPLVQVVRVLLLIGLISLLIPIVSSIILLGVCVLGISRTWFDYDAMPSTNADAE